VLLCLQPYLPQLLVIAPVSNAIANTLAAAILHKFGQLLPLLLQLLCHFI